MEDAPVSNLLEVIDSDYLVIDLFKSNVKHVSDCKDVVEHNEEKLMIEMDFRNAPCKKRLDFLQDMRLTTSRTL